ncbi:MAG: nickel-responsive transcriptional regulator NikR [Planctomycetes bacterium]|nr:nickel-responsive transcriptional regulator NikR [Planctomycetota bacterium]
MASLVRFSVSLESGVLKKFDAEIKRRKCPNRSKALTDLIRAMFVKSEWTGVRNVAGVISVVYDHHKRELVSKLLKVQHKFQSTILSTQHIHMTHSDCLEVIITRGKPAYIESLFNELKSIKGIKYTNLSATTTGENI